MTTPPRRNATRSETHGHPALPGARRHRLDEPAGRIQAVGGINEKIGVLRHRRSRRLTGRLGRADRSTLATSCCEDVVEAVRTGLFHIHRGNGGRGARAAHRAGSRAAPAGQAPRGQRECGRRGGAQANIARLEAGQVSRYVIHEHKARHLRDFRLESAARSPRGRSPGAVHESAPIGASQCGARPPARIRRFGHHSTEAGTGPGPWWCGTAGHEAPRGREPEEAGLGRGSSSSATARNSAGPCAGPCRARDRTGQEWLRSRGRPRRRAWRLVMAREPRTS